MQPIDYIVLENILLLVIAAVLVSVVAYIIEQHLKRNINN